MDEVESTEAIETSAAVKTPAEIVDTPAAASEAPAYPSADDHDWDSWDGKVEALPETVRPWGQRIYDHRQSWVDKEMETRNKEIERLQEIYSGLLEGHEDPRVGEATTALEKLQKSYDALQQDHTVTKSEYEEYKAAIEAATHAEAEAIATQFRETYPEIFSDSKKLDFFRSLLQEDWDLESIPKVMSLPAEALAVARRARVAGTPDEFALQLADTHLSKAAQPRVGAKITSGAEDASPAPHAAGPGRGDAKTLEDMRNNAIAFALKRAKTGGRK